MLSYLTVYMLCYSKNLNNVASFTWLNAIILNHDCELIFILFLKFQVKW